MINVKPQVASLHEVFRLQSDAELEGAECRYMAVRESLSAILLAAGEGADSDGLIARAPKAILKIQGRPILARLLDDFAAFGCRNVTVVRGYRAEAVDVPGAHFVDNPDFASTSEAHSLALALAESQLIPNTLVAFGDIVLKRHIIQALLEEADAGITMAVDGALAGGLVADRVLGDRADTGRLSFEDVHLRAIGDAVPAETSDGVWIGLLHVGRDGATWLAEAIAGVRADGTLGHAWLSDLLSRVLANGHPVRVVYHRGDWVNVNDLADPVDASGLYVGGCPLPRGGTRSIPRRELSVRPSTAGKRSACSPGPTGRS